MKFALVNGTKSSPIPKTSGACPYCNAEVISKCGSIKIWHWAHKGKLVCDPWWENESEWHRNWKNNFPIEWQEVIHFADDGEKHIADIKTDQDWVIEFQYSYLNPEERKSRNKFYKKLIWVVNGKRLQGDEQKLVMALAGRVSFDGFYRVPVRASSLLRAWSDKNSLVFFDFGKSVTQLEESYLWVIMPRHSDHAVYVRPCSRTDFFEIFLNNPSDKFQKFERFLKNWPILAQKYDQQFEESWRKKTDIMHAEIKKEKWRFRKK